MMVPGSLKIWKEKILISSLFRFSVLSVLSHKYDRLYTTPAGPGARRGPEQEKAAKIKEQLTNTK